MMEQRSPEWFAARAGKVTASCIYKVMARTKSGYGADRENYHSQLVTERFGGVTEGFTNAAMAWGTDTEPMARDAYSENALCVVEEVAFVPHPTIDMAGASPDGLVGDKGMVEIKCPNTATHIKTLRGGSIDRKYILQMQWQMACAGRDWCDFASFDPRLPLEMQLYVQRVERDHALIDEIETEVRKFLDEVDEAVADLTARYLMKEAA